MKALDLMVDIEALGSVVTQIGAIFWDRDTGATGQVFLKNLEVALQLQAGLELHIGAVNFWLEEALGGSPLTWRGNTQDPTVVLNLFNAWIAGLTEEVGIRGVWAHASYDFPQLAKLYRTFNIERPWKFRKERDIRTLVDLSGVSLKNIEHTHTKSHDALEDCKYQVEYCFAALQALKGK